MRASEEYVADHVTEVTLRCAAVSHIEYGGCGTHEVKVSLLLTVCQLEELRKNLIAHQW